MFHFLSTVKLISQNLSDLSRRNRSFFLWVELRMAVVIRLQGLPVVAGPADIRRFLSGLNIPDGGVHITGGEKGEAFVIFETDEDARQAMNCSGGYVKNSRIELFLSSKTEMQYMIELNKKRFDRSRRETIESRWTPNNSGVSSNMAAAISKGIGRSGYDSKVPFEDRLHSNGSRNSNTNLSKLSHNHPRSKLSQITYSSKKSNSDNLYLFIRGMPYTAMEDDVLTFFAGLQVDGVIMFKTNGSNNGDGLVKFATPTDATRGLQRDRQYMGNRFIEIHRSNEGTWIKGLEKEGLQMHQAFSDEQFPRDLNKERDPDYQSSRRHTRSKSPLRRVVAHTLSRSPRRMMTHAHSRSPPKRIVAHTLRSPPRSVTTHSHSRSPPRRVMSRTHSRSPPRRITARSRSPISGSTQSYSPHNREHYIHVKNLPFLIEKRELREFFEDIDILSNQITFLKIPGNKTYKDAVVMFNSMRAYSSALGYHKHLLRGQEILLFPISKEAVMELAGFSETKKSPERHYLANEKCDWDRYSDPKTCVYVRNFPYDVTNGEVQKFFAGFYIDEHDVHLLYDDKGNGLGEALVKFRTEGDALRAESLNRCRYWGAEVLVRCISEKQMQEFGINVSPVSDEKVQDHIRPYERGQHAYTTGSRGSSIKHPSDYRHSSSDFITISDKSRDSAPFTDFGEGVHGNFPGGRFLSDSNFSGSSNHFTLIKLKNIPFRAAPNEILDFFHGYKIIPESLSIQHNQYGLPSGEAVIALVNYNEAMAAVNELNDRPIGERKIRLTLV
nr:RNA-binding protein 12B isoform X1 [Anolis sagrei ordinatus]